MSTEAEHPQPPDSAPTDTEALLSDIPPVDDGQDPEPEPEPPPPPAPELPDTTIRVEPATWYAITWVCLTADKGDGEPCVNCNRTIPVGEAYSNAGTFSVQCGMCGRFGTVLSATLLDPQPEYG